MGLAQGYTEKFDDDWKSLATEAKLKVLDAVKAIELGHEIHGWDLKTGKENGDFSVRINENLRLHYTKKPGIAIFLRIIEDFDDLA